jgi:hypothetical protein
MPKLTLEIDCDNDAFQVDRDAELARIFRWLAYRFEYTEPGLTRSGAGITMIFDSNGNCVGKAEFK